MAKSYRAKDASYYIRENGQNVWMITKFLGRMGGDGEVPDSTYTLKCEDGKNTWCDCPASWAGREGVKKHCKHVDWLKRWITIRQAGKVPEGVPIYYNSSDDRFYPMPGLDLSSADIRLES